MGTVRFMGRSPGFSSGGPQTAAWETQGGAMHRHGMHRKERERSGSWDGAQGFQAVDPKPQPGDTQDQTGSRLALKSRAALEEPGISPRPTRDKLSLPAWFAAPVHGWASCLKTSLP